MTYLNKFTYPVCPMSEVTLCEGSSSLGAVLFFLPEGGSKADFRNSVLRLKNRDEQSQKNNIRPIAVNRSHRGSSLELN
jgi:hypothetical protein